MKVNFGDRVCPNLKVDYELESVLLTDRANDSPASVALVTTSTKERSTPNNRV